MTDSLNSSMEFCQKCGQSLVPLQTFHVKRLCKECGQSFYISEPGEKGQGMQTREGDQLIVPAGAIRLSLDPAEATGTFSKDGISWFAELVYFSNQPNTPEEVMSTLEQYEKQAIKIWEEKGIAMGLDLSGNNEEDNLKFFNALKQNKNSAEWWAGEVLNSINIVKNSINNNNVLETVIAMNLLMNSRSMLIFKQVLEDTIWNGYMINHLKNILKIWIENQENDSEEFWQNIFLENPIILSQIFCFPVIILKGKAFVGGKTIDNTNGNIVDFLLANNLSDNVVLIEIKTPKSKLFGSSYRNIYNMSPDLIGAVLQVSNYKDSLMEERTNLAKKKKFYAFNPQCLVITGNLTNEIDDEKRKFFELFRTGLKDVNIITYDELFKKVENLINLIEGKF
ncbi:MAG: Shedu immune nuclease family protein [Planktothrix sp.]|uniref:Shedu immune nuclease family protein n=1 Tax=Planktothrix sp. TaxID=3088171 RepID=UPI0038D41427